MMSFLGNLYIGFVPRMVYELNVISEARKRGVPAYVVLHDSTIDGIATSRPTTLGQLRDIPGIGDKKLEHYGDELIALVKANRAEA